MASLIYLAMIGRKLLVMLWCGGDGDGWCGVAGSGEVLGSIYL